MDEAAGQRQGDKPSGATPRRCVLLLGGTSEARRLAEKISSDSRLEGIISLAGRTSEPLAQSLPTRIGGFGGVAGLCDYLARQGVERVIDATHPFAARMSINAREACRIADRPLARFHRAPWTRQPRDRWIEVADNAAAARALGERPRRVFLTIGRLGLGAFRAAPGHFYLARTIEPPLPEEIPPGCELLYSRGPFRIEEEIALMRAARIDMVVTKNSGGVLTYAKIEAARALGLEVVMIAPPRVEGVATVHDETDALAFLTAGLAQ